MQDQTSRIWGNPDMAETKEDIAAERDALRAENEKLRADVAALARQGIATITGQRVVAPEHAFELSEGDRQELVLHGEVNVGGRMRTADEVRGMLGDDQRDVDLGDAPAPAGTTEQPRSAIRGVDYVYPSVEPGFIDPAVAGTPGINGPSADAQHGASDDRPEA